MKKNRKIILAILSLALVLSAGIGGTYAILNFETESKENKFTHGVVNITIEEPGFDGTADGDGYYLKPVRIKNNSMENELAIVDCYAMVKLVVNWVDDEGNIYPVNNLASKIILYTEKGKAGIGEGWIYSEEDGVYYYEKVLKTSGSESESTPLMKYVTVDTEGLPSGGHLEMNVLSQAVMAGDADNYEEAWSSVK